VGDQVVARWPNSAFASLVAAIPGCTYTKIEEGRAIRVADEEGGPHPEARPHWRELRGGRVGRDVIGTIFLDGMIKLGKADGANFPRPYFRLGSALLATASTVLLDLAIAKIAGDVNVRTLFQRGREFGNWPEASDAVPLGLGLPFAVTISPRPLGGERKYG
jgi:hypothetical protein